MGHLALSYFTCNRRNGSDISSIDIETGAICPLFSPRTQMWRDHFRLDDVRIAGSRPVGKTTVELLNLNSFERFVERGELIRAKRFPPLS